MWISIGSGVGDAVLFKAWSPATSIRLNLRFGVEEIGVMPNLIRRTADGGKTITPNRRTRRYGILHPFKYSKFYKEILQPCLKS
jgi:hypothetical protein